MSLAPISKPRFSFKKLQLNPVGVIGKNSAMVNLVPPLTQQIGKLQKENGFDISDLFVEFDKSPRPARVSAELWSSVFPPDREQVRLLAGRYLLRGIGVEEAIQRAMKKVEFDKWMSNPESNLLLTTLSRAFEPEVDMTQPSRYIDVALAVNKTATQHWSSILAHEGFQNPIRAAFWYREWHSNKCLICQEDLKQDCLPIKGNSGQDFIDKSCQDRIAQVGPIFGELVVQKCVVIKEQYQEPLSLHFDPDEADAFSSFTIDDNQVN